MKRSPLRRKAPLERLSGLSRGRKPIKQVSDKRRATFGARRECVRIVKERDVNCQFWIHVCDTELSPEDFARCIEACHCEGRMEVHEPAHRSQGADPTDPEQCLLVCAKHHRFAHNWPLLAKSLRI